MEYSYVLRTQHVISLSLCCWPRVDLSLSRRFGCAPLRALFPSGAATKASCRPKSALFYRCLLPRIRPRSFYAWETMQPPCGSLLPWFSAPFSHSPCLPRLRPRVCTRKERAYSARRRPSFRRSYGVLRNAEYLRCNYGVRPYEVLRTRQQHSVLSSSTLRETCCNGLGRCPPVYKLRRKLHDQRRRQKKKEMRKKETEAGMEGKETPRNRKLETGAMAEPRDGTVEP